MSQERKKTVLIADDHALLAEGIATMLASEYKVEGIVPDGRQLITEAVRLRPDIVVLDISMPELNGIEAAVQIRKAVPNAKLVFVTQRVDVPYLRAAFRAGAVGYVAKQSASSELLTALRQVSEGKQYVTPLLEGVAVSDPASGPRRVASNELTMRQREVLRMIAEGNTARSIGEALHISPKTVEFHKKALMDMTGLRTTAELTKYAIAYGIVTV